MEMIKVTLKFKHYIPTPYFELLMLTFETYRQSPKFYTDTSIVRININTLEDYLNSDLVWATKGILIQFIKWCKDKKIDSLTIETFGSNCVNLFFEDKQSAMFFKLGDQQCIF
jgi:hypothetical protein